MAKLPSEDTEEAEEGDQESLISKPIIIEAFPSPTQAQDTVQETVITPPVSPVKATTVEVLVNNTTSRQEIRKNEGTTNIKNQKIRRRPEVCLQESEELKKGYRQRSPLMDLELQTFDFRYFGSFGTYLDVDILSDEEILLEEIKENSKDTWKGFSILAFKDLCPIIKLFLSSGVRLCLELWYNTILILLTGNMKNAEVAIDALSICLNINGWEMMIALGFLAAAR
ncbi:hypothetical protein AgCh_004644 [Apium graveolens]